MKGGKRAEKRRLKEGEVWHLHCHSHLPAARVDDFSSPQVKLRVSVLRQVTS